MEENKTIGEWKKEFDELFVLHNKYDKLLVSQSANIKSFITRLLESERERSKKIITDEIATAHKEGEKTSRLTSAYNRISNLN